MVTPETETPEALKDKPAVEQPAVTGVSPSAPAPVISEDKDQKAPPVAAKPSLLKRLLNVLTGKPAESEVEEPAQEIEEKPKREQNRRPPRTRNTNRRGPRNRRPAKPVSETTETDDKSKSSTQPTVDKENTATDANEENKGRSNQARRSRRGGRRRRPRTENDSQADGEGYSANKAIPEKQAVEGNAVVQAAPEVDGNTVPSDKAKEVDGNTPAAPAKKPAPRKPRTSTGPRRRRPQANKDKGENQTGVDKKSTSSDNSANKVEKATPDKVEPKADANK
ncbi:hypothetical protein A9Q92_03255 [Methylophaga sp. 42_8_T64]|nr:hypothetical protein A9Q92_03255 [Methylophaga sp. 42_8_T64]